MELPCFCFDFNVMIYDLPSSMSVLRSSKAASNFFCGSLLNIAYISAVECLFVFVSMRFVVLLMAINLLLLKPKIQSDNTNVFVVSSI